MADVPGSPSLVVDKPTVLTGASRILSSFLHNSCATPLRHAHNLGACCLTSFRSPSLNYEFKLQHPELTPNGPYRVRNRREHTVKHAASNAELFTLHLVGETSTMGISGQRINLLSGKGTGTRASHSSYLFTAPRALAGQSQERAFRRANYIEKIGDNEQTEERMEKEKLETRVDEQHDRPRRQVLDEEGKKNPPPKTQSEKWSEDMTKGKMLTTPSRLFKLIIPLTTTDQGHDKGVEPIALLVHPQQPLSYIERLIQSELPPIDGECEKRPPAISFIALQHEDNAIKPRKKIEDDIDMDAIYNDTHGQENGQKSGGGAPIERRRRSREEDAETYSYPRKTDSSLDPLNGEPERFVRWSQATEVGDFLRDAARTREFIVTIEGAPAGLGQIRITVPSFNERTYFLRMRLRKLSRQIQGIAEVKHECDVMALRGAQRVAIGGFGILATWWFTVYKLTFETDLGWDTMEPVTYLVSLSTLMGGYLWFLYHNREISYKSALDFTVSARQRKLYQLHNVDLQLWESLIDEGKALRREIKSIAAEYDAEWDERVEEQDERVTQALKSHRNKEGEKKSRGDKDGADDD
ncbi:uncharacterized protein N7482_004545 [Penicillium canariense]|uniref:Calcium uniporter protein, mitochondrial n=1 Tax=Penicillium canariense TaxID=189055 RepID=A0A9W9I6T4_9EURO|nr:uncharacterized protein N7482_004545 [Penicillium canariense]KAJ5168951.1 hypothetical protein N7482_004545 [Penicillium canariense]